MNTTSKKTQVREKEPHGSLKVCLYLGFSIGNNAEDESPYGGAQLKIYRQTDGELGEEVSYYPNTTEDDGCIETNLEAGTYYLGLPTPSGLSIPAKGLWQSSDVQIKLNKQSEFAGPFTIEDCKRTTFKFIAPSTKTHFAQYLQTKNPGCTWDTCADIVQGRAAQLVSSLPTNLGVRMAEFPPSRVNLSQLQEISQGSSMYSTALIDTQNDGDYEVTRKLQLNDGSYFMMTNNMRVIRDVQNIGGDIKTTTTLTRTETSFTEDVAFWTGIRNSTEALSFNTYLRFMDWIFCGGDKPLDGFEAGRFPVKQDMYRDLRDHKRFLPFTDSDAYRVVKAATEAFVMVNCGNLMPVLDDKGTSVLTFQPFNMDMGPKGDSAYLDRRDLPAPPNRDLRASFNGAYLEKTEGNGMVLPYLAVIRKKLPDIPIKFGAFEDAIPGSKIDNCFGLLQEKLANPCLLELIWSYWHEEGMLVQSMNAISRRFQNIRSSARDPLSTLEMDPLRPLNNLFWGYIQDEQHRLTVGRRNYEYDHHYGLRLEGKAVQDFRPVDTRSKFLEAFHHLLRLCTVFYKQDDDTTVKADAFPVLNALKEVHLILSQGAHNQFGDLPSTARIEMLMQQWLLARPEFREFLPTRIMVAYPEPWMDRVDAMKKLQGWTDTSVLHFRNLGMFGEQLLLSIRWGHWSDEFEPVKALNWARFFRPQAQGYIHAYRAATGIDLSADPTVNARVDSTMPSVLLQKRLAAQQRAV